MKKWKVAGINFDHMHMHGLLGFVQAHPQAEIVGICHEVREVMSSAADYHLPDSLIFTDYRRCLEQTQPDIVILCPATATHGLWTRRVAAYNVHIIMEKPFAASVAEADEMWSVADPTAVASNNKQLAINWPLAWYPPHRTTKRLLDEGLIGEVLEVHYYDGNKADFFAPDSWFLQKDKGGGSLLDYLGYGVTLGTWFHGNRIPQAVLTLTHVPDSWEVDNHSLTIARYAHGLSKYETRWGAFTSPWIHQPQPKCGFVVVGSAGTISSYDYEPTIRVQTEEKPQGFTLPVDELHPPYQNPVQYVIHCLETGQPIEGPLSVTTARIGQQIVDAAIQSAATGRLVALEG